MEIQEVAQGVYRVVSGENAYIVRMSPASCTCPGFRYRRTCKHLEAVSRAAGEKQEEIRRRMDEMARRLGWW